VPTNDGYYSGEVRAMRCARCGWPSDEAEVLSTHHTSQGWVRYRRCVCGAVTIQLVTLGAATGTQVEPLRTPDGTALGAAVRK
jgi:hypothetical protein